MYIWAFRYQYLQLQTQAEQHWRISSLKYFSNQWHLLLLKRRALKFRAGILLSRYFHLWNNRQKLIQHSRLLAVYFYTKVSYTLSGNI